MTNKLFLSWVETSWFESWENLKNSEGVNQFKEQPLETAPLHRLFHSVNVSWWDHIECATERRPFGLWVVMGLGGLAYLLFCAAYWSRQPRVFRPLSRSCLELGSQWVQKYIERLSVKMKCAIQHQNSTHPYGSDFPGCQVQTIQLRYSENDKQ